MGDATESAILKCMETLLGNVEHFRQRNQKLCEIPFNSTDKFQVSIHRWNSDSNSKYLLAMKVRFRFFKRALFSLFNVN